MKISAFLYVLLFSIKFVCNSADERRKLPFNAKEMFGNYHHFAEEANDITGIEVLDTETVPNAPSLPEYGPLVNPYEPDFSIMRRLFDRLASVRNHQNPTIKREARDYIATYLVNYLDRESVFMNPFLVSGEEYFLHFQSFEEETFKGTNIVGVMKGPRFGQINDTVLVIGAHWDTFKNCPGVDDNGSGVVAVLELVRLLKVKKASIPFTIYFVLFDFEEYGLIGSYVFTASFVAPRILNGSINVIGMYSFDMVLNYNSSNNSQILSDFEQTSFFNFTEEALIKSNPELVKEILDNGSKGDFITVFSRKEHDERLSNAILTAFNSFRSNIELKLYNFQAPLSKIASGLTNEMRANYGLFSLSDHSNFWYPSYENSTKNIWNIPSREHNFTINAVTFTDTGKYRGIQKTCYHKFCDNAAQLTNDNLEFLAAVIKTADISIDILVEEYLTTVQISERKQLNKCVILILFLVALTMLSVCPLILIAYFSNKTIQKFALN